MQALGHNDHNDQTLWPLAEAAPAIPEERESEGVYEATFFV